MPGPEPTSEDLVHTIEGVAHTLVLVWGRSAERVRPKVSTSQLRALIVVGRHDRITLLSLADELGSTPPVTSRLCDRMQAAGLVSRTAGVQDRREVVLALTRDGRRLLQRFHRERAADLRQVLDQMTDREREALRRGLTGFHNAAYALGLPEEELA